MKVPPLRMSVALGGITLPFGYFSTRRTPGDEADGVLLRAVDPTDAANWLVAAGAQPTDDPGGWLLAHRSVVTEPAERAAVLSREMQARRLLKAASVMGWICVLLMAAGTPLLRVNEPIAFIVLGAVLVSGVAAWLLRRSAARRLK